MDLNVNVLIPLNFSKFTNLETLNIRCNYKHYITNYPKTLKKLNINTSTVKNILFQDNLNLTNFNLYYNSWCEESSPVKIYNLPKSIENVNII